MCCVVCVKRKEKKKAKNNPALIGLAVVPPIPQQYHRQSSRTQHIRRWQGGQTFFDPLTLPDGLAMRARVSVEHSGK